MNFNKVLTIMVALALFLVIASTVANLIPWYTQTEPMKIAYKEKAFNPGAAMAIKLERKALIGFEGRVTRELVKLHVDGTEEEVYKMDRLISVDQGTKKITIYYRLPTIRFCPQMTGNTYVWRGSMVYKPFGFLEKTYFFRTEKFQIEVKPKV